MKTEKLSSWKTIQKLYPDEWVLLANVIIDAQSQVKKGLLVAHSKQKVEVASHPVNKQYSELAFLYTGNLFPKDAAILL